MEIKPFLDFLPANFRHEKTFFIQNNLTDFEKLSNLSDLDINEIQSCLLYTSPSPRDQVVSRMPSSA